MVLLELLSAIGQWDLAVFHYNHMLRGHQADEDETFVREACRKRGIDFLLGKSDVAAECAANRWSFEEGARRIRYRFFLDNMEGFDALVLGHHADDQAETVMLNFIRGAGVKGLGGMQAWDEERHLLRPLLSVSKETLSDYAERVGLAWREDHTNASNEYDRNWVRNSLIPEIEGRRQGFRQVLARSSDYFGALHGFLEQQARDWIASKGRVSQVHGVSLPVSDLLDVHGVLRGEILAQMWEGAHGSRHGFTVKRVREVEIWMAANKNGSTSWFGKDHCLVNRSGVISLRAVERKPSPPAPER